MFLLSIRLGPALLAVLAVVLAACGGGGSQPPATSVSVAPAFLSFDGTSSATFQVTANGTWKIASNSDWLKVNRSSGPSGVTTVTVTIDRNGLSPNQQYAGGLTLSGAGSTELATVTVSMRFPKVTGNVVDPEGDVTPGVRAAAVERQAPAGAASLAADHRTVPGEYLVLLNRDMGRALEALASGAALSAVEPGLATLKAMGTSLASDYGLVVARDVRIPRLPFMVVRADVSAMARLAADGRVRAVAPNFTWVIPRVDGAVSLAGYDFGRQWHYENIDLEQAWDVTAGESTVVVAVIDGGFATAHADLAGNLLAGYDFAFGDADPSANDVCVEHGTHVAGTVAATFNAVENVVGVAPGVRIRPVRIGYADAGDCSLSGDGLLGAMAWVAGLEVEGVPQIPAVDIVNMSLGGGHNVVLQAAVQEMLAEGVTVIAASGNDGSDDIISYPAAYPGVIAVGATNINDVITWYSNAGPELDLVAPGGETHTDHDLDGNPDGVLSLGWDTLTGTETYVYEAGTSMATPHVSGVAALIKSVNPDLTSAEVRDVLTSTARDLGSPGRDKFYGHGIVDAGAAVKAAAGTAVPRFSRVTVRLRSGATVVATTKVSASGAFELGPVAAGTYVLEAGTDLDFDGLIDDAGEYYASTTVNVTYAGDATATLDLSPR